MAPKAPNTTLTRLRRAEKARTGDPTGKSLLLVVTRAADNSTRRVELSQRELACRIECDEKTVRAKVRVLVEKRLIYRERRNTAGGRRWDRITVLDLDEDGNPVRPTDEMSVGPTGVAPVGLAGGVPVGPTVNRSEPNGNSRRVSKKASPSQSDLPENSSSSKTRSNLPDEGSRAAPKKERPRKKKTPKAPRSFDSSNGNRAAASNSQPRSQTSPTGASPAGPPTEAEIRKALAAAPLDRIVQTCGRFDLGLEDLYDMGFRFFQDGSLVERERPDWYPRQPSSARCPEVAEWWEATP